MKGCGKGARALCVYIYIERLIFFRFAAEMIVFRIRPHGNHKDLFQVFEGATTSTTPFSLMHPHSSHVHI